jgi:hypothetical protein
MKITWCFLALVLAGCASLPNTERTGEFGKATLAATTFAKDSITANRTITLRINDELLAYAFVDGRCPEKGEPGYNEKCKSSPVGLAGKDRAKVLSPDATGKRIRALEALGEYGEALAKAIDQGQLDKLELAAVKLGDAAAGLTSLFPPVSPVVSPAIKIAARGFGYALSTAYVAEVNTIVAQMDDSIREITKFLREDFNQLATLLGEQVTAYEASKASSLGLIRRRGDIDSLRLLTEFKAARQDYAAVHALALAAGRFSAIFKQVAETHEGLAHDDPDTERTLRRLIALIGDANELVKAAKVEKKS